MQQTVRNGSSILELGIQELHRVTVDESARKTVDQNFNEARGRETARLHVQLSALTEADRRAAEHARETLEAIGRLTADLQDRAAKLSHLIESFEQVAEKRFQGVHDDVRTRTDALTAQVRDFSNAELNHFDSIKAQVGAFQNAVTTQVGETKTSLSVQADHSTERLAQDIRSLRDEVVRLVDSRMNQSDAAFAAVRGDVEVVKYLVMDIIKDRIGRSDPKQKPF